MGGSDVVGGGKMTDQTESSESNLSQGTLALAAAIVLGLAAVLTAWAAFRGSLTSDLVLKNYSAQQATIAQANDIFSRADQQEQLEYSLFLDFIVAISAGNVDASDYLYEVMSEEMKAATEWWSSQPEDVIPPTPFTLDNPAFADLPSQILIAEGEALLDEAESLRLAAEDADTRSDRFDLSNVFFAVVLFVAGLATLVQRRSIQVSFLVLSTIGVVAGFLVLATTSGAFSLN